MPQCSTVFTLISQLGNLSKGVTKKVRMRERHIFYVWGRERALVASPPWATGLQVRRSAEGSSSEAWTVARVIVFLPSKSGLWATVHATGPSLSMNHENAFITMFESLDQPVLSYMVLVSEKDGCVEFSWAWDCCVFCVSRMQCLKYPRPYTLTGYGTGSVMYQAPFTPSSPGMIR